MNLYGQERLKIQNLKFRIQLKLLTRFRKFLLQISLSGSLMIIPSILDRLFRVLKFSEKIVTFLLAIIPYKTTY